MVDDQVREAVARFCTEHRMLVLGQCGDGLAALAMITRLQPEITILDDHMPGVSGVGVVRKLRAGGSKVKLMIFSIDREEKTAAEAMNASADAYLLGACSERSSEQVFMSGQTSL